MKRIVLMMALVIVAARLGEMDDNWDFIAHQAAALDLWNMVHPQVVEAGHPACDPEHPKVPPCDMKSCAQMGKDGKPTGSRCNHYCMKKGSICCGCGSSCNVEYPGTPSPDEGSPE